ncbi:hypothetical protein CRENBAI_010849 [Crenichthys baileyi]|uniref:Uncharacterized protein n=1 Tax=Crenichthys baileyi TaxID=28760 RepID=A0AAV9S0N4_9TELE
MASELITSDPSLALLGPGTTQYLLSLAQVGLSACVRFPDRWGGFEQRKQLLDSLLRSPQYEVRELALEGILRKLHEEEEEEEIQRSPLWLDETAVSDLTNMAVHETHQQCLAKVLQVLCVLNSRGELSWKNGAKTLSQKEVLMHLLTLAQNFTHSVDLLSAALTLASQLVVELVSSDHQDPAVVAYLVQWGALVCSCCGEEQPVEVKLMVAKVLVTCSSSLMTNPHLPLGFPATVSLWRSLFTLLQDEDQDVRDSASDFTSRVPAHLLSKASQKLHEGTDTLTAAQTHKQLPARIRLVSYTFPAPLQTPTLYESLHHRMLSPNMT